MKQWKCAVATVCLCGLLGSAEAADWHLAGIGTTPLPNGVEVHSLADGYVTSEYWRQIKAVEMPGVALAALGNVVREVPLEMLADPAAMQAFTPSLEVYQLRGEDAQGIHTAFALTASLPLAEAEVLAKEQGQGAWAKFLREAHNEQVTPAVAAYLTKGERFMEEAVALERAHLAKGDAQRRAQAESTPAAQRLLAAMMPAVAEASRLEVRQVEPLHRFTRKRGSSTEVFYETGARLTLTSRGAVYPFYVRLTQFQRGADVKWIMWLMADAEYAYFKPKADLLVYRLRGEA